MSRKRRAPASMSGRARKRPGDPLTPNEKTIAAMREVRAGKLPRFKGAKDLLREMNEGD
jgi:hypothetical protein